MTTYHQRNPIKRHGDNPGEHFTQVPNELVRDTALGLHAYRLAIVIRSHADGFEVSAASLAKDIGWHRDTAAKALRELVAARWLAIRPYRTLEGNRAFDEYHVHVSRRFTPTEAEQYSTPVVLGHAHSVGTPMPTEQAPPCLPDRHPHACGVGTKEHHLEDQSENKQEHQRDNDCYGCTLWGQDGCSVHSPKRELVTVGASHPPFGEAPASMPEEEPPF